MSQQPIKQTFIQQSSLFIKTSFNHILSGILVVLPIYIVVQIFVWLVDFVLHAVFEFRRWVGRYWLTTDVFVAIYVLLAYIGNEIARHRQPLAISLFDLLIGRAPRLRGVYRISKKAIEMFRGQGDSRVREVAHVVYPKDGVWVPAYVTNREDNRHVLYIPASPNPTNGLTVIVDESKLVKPEPNFQGATSFVVRVGLRPGIEWLTAPPWSWDHAAFLQFAGLRHLALDAFFLGVTWSGSLNLLMPPRSRPSSSQRYRCDSAEARFGRH